MNLSYSIWRDWKECPKRYFLKHRKQEPPTIKPNDYHKIYGLLMQEFFTNYANIWRLNTPYMPPEFIKEKMTALRGIIIPTLSVDWSAFFVKYTEDEIFDQACNDACLIMSTPETSNLFLNSKSEVDLKVATKDGIDITCRMDFIHTYPIDKRVLIFDGKGTNKVKKTVDEDQLLFYALLYRLHYGRMPDELGFFYYRFNRLAPVLLTIDILNQFRARLSMGIKAMLTESEFRATPTPKGCKWCEYRVGCKEKEEREMANRRGSRIKNLPDQEGVLEFSF
jgi:hypothetical protein